MGYDFEDAWNELKGVFRELKPNEESEAPLGNNARKWIRDKMADIEQNISKVG